MSKHILIVDDDHEIAHLVSISLKNEGFTTTTASNGVEALRKMDEHQIDLIVLDVMMPEMNGLEFCQTVRQTQDLPILMISAKSEDMDKITGIMTGADDYLIKPFNILELIVRIKALLRRAYYYRDVPKDNSLLELGELTINKKKYQAIVGGLEIKLTSKEFEILYLLASNAGQVFDSETIFQRVWKEKYYDSNNTVMVHISNLRDKLEKALGYKVIQTVWGVGYKVE
ncbi:response regulator transcription factor [Alkalicoccobacillus murimartini]|uniref:DNA-binding response OmpR family regulator n=1 Tax=Alkalicoccobacillus murimartini TaxID=171685 RepID=A0ABT9YI23_9BACI|nr:response regulator transcription factor [Alkalicoccobacillus murimartini]MDQ0207482.1 DNA-binding response OmpR family regulator [Alkalicoccobacillus murimartini]